MLRKEKKNSMEISTNKLLLLQVLKCWKKRITKLACEMQVRKFVLFWEWFYGSFAELWNLYSVVVFIFMKIDFELFLLTGYY